MAKADDWFSSADWSPRAQREFESKLQRARNKDEYLRIKGIALVGAGDRERREAGRQLLLRLVREYPDSLTVSWAHEFLGHAYALDALHEHAETHYREALAAYEKNPNVRGHAQIALAELITLTRQRPKYGEAEALLDAYEPFFKIDHFRVFTVRARLAAEHGEDAEAASHAKAALALEADNEPQFPRHPDVGHVKTDAKTLRELRNLARR